MYQFLIECTNYSSPQNSESQQWMHNTNTAHFSGLHTMMSFLLSVLALLQCVPVISFDGLFNRIKQCSSKWQKINSKHIKIEFIKIIQRPLTYKQELIYTTKNLHQWEIAMYPYCSDSRAPHFLILDGYLIVFLYFSI